MRALTVCLRTGLLVAILCVCGAAQTAPAINGPSLGFVADKGLAASHDGRSIFVAQEGSEDISVTDLQSRTTVVVPCHCTATVFSPLKGTSVFRLNGLSTGPITVLDAHPGLPPRTLIIPVNPSKFSKEAQGER